MKENNDTPWQLQLLSTLDEQRLCVHSLAMREEKKGEEGEGGEGISSDAGERGRKRIERKFDET